MVVVVWCYRRNITYAHSAGNDRFSSTTRMLRRARSSTVLCSVTPTGYDGIFRSASGPFSSYSAFVTQILRNVERPARIDPPVHVVKSLSVGAVIRIFMSGGAIFRVSLRSRLQKPLNMVEPPESTIPCQRFRRRSMSDRAMALVSTSWIPRDSSPTSAGLKRASGARKRAGPSEICLPSGRLYSGSSRSGSCSSAFFSSSGK